MELKNELELNEMNRTLSSLKVSHLKIYSEKESSQVWDDWDKENGIKSKYIDADLIVTDIYHNSESFHKGVKIGDVALSFNNKDVNEEKLKYANGLFKFKRKNKTYEVHLNPQKLIYDNKVKINRLDNSSNEKWVIKVPSFKKEYFDEKSFLQFHRILKNKKISIIDLRENVGGNFVAGLRFLSLFSCGRLKIGEIHRKPNTQESTGEFEDTLDDQNQIHLLDKYSKINLYTFDRYPCLQKPDYVLIDASTSSTAELVALAFRELFSTKIWGAGSAGQLLVGIWYDLDNLWQLPIKISIPEANYFSVKNQEIEQWGVSVDRVLYERGRDFQEEKDSWVQQIIEIEKSRTETMPR